MARAVLLVAGTAWIVASVLGLVLAIVGVDTLLEILPPLAIDGEAVGRTIVAMSVMAAVVGIGHLTIGLGVRADRGWAVNAGILLAAGAGMLSVALAAAAFTSAASGTMEVFAGIGAGIGALLSAAAYGLAGAALVHRLRLGGLR